MKHDRPNITVYCAGCSKKISVPERVANGPEPVFCSDECQMDQEHMQFLDDARNDERRNFRASPCNTGDYLED